MTVETAVKVDGEKCGMDVVSSSCEDRPPSSVGGGDGNVDGKDDYVFVNGSDAGSDDHGDVEGKRELIVSASNGEFEGNLEGVGVNVNGGDQLDASDKGYNGKLDNVGNVDGDESKSESGGIVEEESDGKVEGGELVKKNGEIKLESEDVVVDRESTGESGDANNVVGGDDVAVRDMEVVKETDVDDNVEDLDSGVEKGDETNASVDGIGNLSVDDDEKEKDLSGVDSGSGVVQNGSSVVEVEPQVSLVESGDQLHLGRSEEDENQAKEPEKLGDGVITSELVEDKVNLHIDEVQVTDSEPVDDTVKELKPLEVEVKREIQEDGIIENQPPDGYIKSPDRVVEELLLDESMTEKQKDLQLVDSGEPAPVEAEAEVRELGDSGALELSGSQDLDTVDSEAAASELKQNGEIEAKDQDASELTTESVECQEPQTVLESKGAVNQSNVELMASEVDSSALNSTVHSDEAATDQTDEVNGNPETLTVDLQSDTDKPVVDHELERVHGEQKAESSAQLRGCLDSSVQDVSLQDQVAEETEAVDVIDKEASSEDHTSEKTIIAEEATDLSVVNSSNEANVDEEDQDLDASHVGDTGAANEVHVPETSHDSGSCLRSEDGDVTVAVGNEMDIPVPCDSDLREGTVAEEGSLAGDNDISSSADDGCSQPKQENSSNALPSANGNESEVKTALGEVDLAPLNPMISFGSFNPNLQIDRNNVQPNVMNRSINFSTSQSDFVGNSKSITDTADVVASLKSEANNVHSTDLNHDKNGAGTEEVSASSVEEYGNNSVSGLDVNPDLVRRPFYYLIRIPKFDDVKLNEEIRISEEEVKEKTLNRDVVRTKWQNYKASLSDSKTHLEAARSEERAAHKLLMAKKREIDSAQSLLNLARNAITVEDVDSRIRNMEHKMEHETLILAEEKKLLGEIKKMKQQREQLAANTRSQQELQQALDRRVETEDHLKILRKEMDALRSNHAKASEIFKALKKKSDEESALLRDLHNQFCSADTIRQKAYVQLQTLKKQAYEKNKLFYYYKDAAKVAYDLAGVGKKDSLEQHCLNQVDKIMELWNSNDEFRKEYIRCNERSTLRRFKTKDGRALGPDEEPPSFEMVSSIRQKVVTKVNSVGAVPSLERDFPLVTKTVQEESSKKATEQKNKTALGKKRVDSPSKDSVAESSGRIDVEEKVEKEHKPTKEEEELIRKEEQKRREEEEKQRKEEEKWRKEEEVRLKEQHRLEEIAKAKEAQLRKKRLAEKAQVRAEARARKEAEEKLKEKEKRAKKKEKKKGIISEITETEPAQLPESSSETIREPEVTEKPVAVTKKSHKPALYTKQVKTTKSISAPPAPLRNRGKRRIPQWVWWLVLTILTVILIFPLGNKDIVGFFKHVTSGSSY